MSAQSAQKSQGEPYVLKWGIISTGGIATNFSKVSWKSYSSSPPHSIAPPLMVPSDTLSASRSAESIIQSRSHTPPLTCIVVAVKRNIAKSQDLLVDPSTRDAPDVLHKIVAVGSRSTESAESFIAKLKASEDASKWGVENGSLEGVKGYGSYEEVYNDPVS
jgi:hypothetical protein